LNHNYTIIKYILLLNIQIKNLIFPPVSQSSKKPILGKLLWFPKLASIQRKEYSTVFSSTLSGGTKHAPKLTHFVIAEKKITVHL
jgi:hypothetical protein